MSEEVKPKPSAREIFATVQAKTVRGENAAARGISKNLNKRIDEFVANYYKQREEDLLAVIMEHHEEIDGDMSSLEQIMQADPEGNGHVAYRGIKLNGRFVVDHFPDWPDEKVISQE